MDNHSTATELAGRIGHARSIHSLQSTGERLRMKFMAYAMPNNQKVRVKWYGATKTHIIPRIPLISSGQSSQNHNQYPSPLAFR